MPGRSFTPTPADQPRALAQLRAVAREFHARRRAYEQQPRMPLSHGRGRFLSERACGSCNTRSADDGPRECSHKVALRHPKGRVGEQKGQPGRRAHRARWPHPTVPARGFNRSGTERIRCSWPASSRKRGRSKHTPAPLAAGELERELEATKTELRAAVLDLELSGEGQKAVNEDALSVNEEFESTIEELLSSKAEL
jgi:hypothetical protein